MQLRQVASIEAASVSRSYDPTDGWAKNEQVQSIQTSWTNTSPIPQWVYGMVTKSGSQMTLQCRSRGYLATSHGYEIGGDGSSITMFEVSRYGVGADVGKGGILAIGSAFSIAELRQHSTSCPLMPHLPGWFAVDVGETIHAKVNVEFRSEFWENNSIDGGDADTESRFISGDIRLDLFALPAITEPPPRSIPTVVGGGSNIKHDIEVDLGLANQRTEVAVPDGTTTGDVLLAIVCNQLGFGWEITPVEDGWMELHSRNEGLSGWQDVHMKIYMRYVDEAPPATYKFENSGFAEEIATLIAIRGAVPYDVDGPNWYVASNLSRFKFVETQTAPSMNLGGQLMLSVSYLSHWSAQAPINQTAPEGMTLLKSIPGSVSTLAIAQLASPPKPTLERRFTPSATPIYSGHSLTASILIPGST